MDEIYEVDISANARKTVHIKAENAEEACKIAAILYVNGDRIGLRDKMNIGITADAVENDDHFEKTIAPINIEKLLKQCIL